MYKPFVRNIQGQQRPQVKILCFGRNCQPHIHHSILMQAHPITRSQQNLSLNLAAVTPHGLSSGTANGYHREETPRWLGGSVDITQSMYQTHNRLT